MRMKQKVALVFLRTEVGGLEKRQNVLADAVAKIIFSLDQIRSDQQAQQQEQQHLQQHDEVDQPPETTDEED